MNNNTTTTDKLNEFEGSDYYKTIKIRPVKLALYTISIILIALALGNQLWNNGKWFMTIISSSWVCIAGNNLIPSTKKK